MPSAVFRCTEYFLVVATEKTAISSFEVQLTKQFSTLMLKRFSCVRLLIVCSECCTSLMRPPFCT